MCVCIYVNGHVCTCNYGCVILVAAYLISHTTHLSHHWSHTSHPAPLILHYPSHTTYLARIKGMQQEILGHSNKHWCIGLTSTSHSGLVPTSSSHLRNNFAGSSSHDCVQVSLKSLKRTRNKMRRQKYNKSWTGNLRTHVTHHDCSTDDGTSNKHGCCDMVCLSLDDVRTQLHREGKYTGKWSLGRDPPHSRHGMPVFLVDCRLQEKRPLMKNSDDHNQQCSPKWLALFHIRLHPAGARHSGPDFQYEDQRPWKPLLSNPKRRRRMRWPS